MNRDLVTLAPIDRLERSIAWADHMLKWEVSPSSAAAKEIRAARRRDRAELKKRLKLEK
jgi:hypothetical protein